MEAPCPAPLEPSDKAAAAVLDEARQTLRPDQFRVLSMLLARMPGVPGPEAIALTASQTASLTPSVCAAMLAVPPGRYRLRAAKLTLTVSGYFPGPDGVSLLGIADDGKVWDDLEPGELTPEALGRPLAN